MTLYSEATKVINILSKEIYYDIEKLNLILEHKHYFIFYF